MQGIKESREGNTPLDHGPGASPAVSPPPLQLQRSCRDVNDHESFTAAFDAFMRIKDALPRADSMAQYTDYSTRQGWITLTWSFANDALAVYAVAVTPCLQKQGVFTRFLQHVSNAVARVDILAVESIVLQNFLRKFKLKGEAFRVDKQSNWSWCAPKQN
jgi:hypothetical protein